MQRIKKYSSKQPGKIIIVSKPGLKYSYNNRTAKAQNWVYFLPAFQQAHMQSFYRRFEDSLLRIKEIKDYISEFNPHINLLVKPHPSDDITLFKMQEGLTSKTFNNLINHCSLAFTEDSTVTAELLGHTIPVIYFGDRSDFDPFKLKNGCVDFVYCGFKESIINKLTEIKQPDIAKRKKMFRYFFGDCSC